MAWSITPINSAKTPTMPMLNAPETMTKASETMLKAFETNDTASKMDLRIRPMLSLRAPTVNSQLHNSPRWKRV